MANIELRLGKDVLVVQGPMGTQLMAQGLTGTSLSPRST